MTTFDQTRFDLIRKALIQGNQAKPEVSPTSLRGRLQSAKTSAIEARGEGTKLFKESTAGDLTAGRAIPRAMGSIAKGTVGQVTGAIGGFFKPEIEQATGKISKEFIQPITQKIPEEVKSQIAGNFKLLSESVSPENKETLRDLTNTLRVLDILPAGFATEKATQKLFGAAPALIEDVAKLGVAGRNIAREARLPSILRGGADAKRLATIEEVIAPKLTAVEQRSIVSQNRATRGKESILWGKQQDIIEQTREIKEATKIIDNRIKNANKLDDLSMKKAIDGEITKTAKNLKPQMQAIQVNTVQVRKLENSWESLKTLQADSPEFANFPGSSKVQQQFGNYLDDLKRPVRDTTGKFRQKSLDDFWEARKNYDDSISENVKRATDMSPPFLQLQKEMWLQNRALFNDVINDISTGLGRKSQNAFREMSRLYLASGNITKKAVISSKALPGILNRRNLLKVGVGAVAGYLGGKILNR